VPFNIINRFCSIIKFTKGFITVTDDQGNADLFRHSFYIKKCQHRIPSDVLW